jgi:hypothetical protein
MREFTMDIEREIRKDRTKSLLNEKFVGYKMVTEDFKSPFVSMVWWRDFWVSHHKARPLSYRPGETHKSRDAKKHIGPCTVGLHVCPTVDGLRVMEGDYFAWFDSRIIDRPKLKYVKIEFSGRDVVDFSTSDKLRLQRCRVIVEIDALGNLIGEDSNECKTA